MKALDVRALSTRFELKTGVARAVDDVSFSIAPGRILALVGESGSGKSVTAMSVMNLIDEPGRIAAGEVFLDGIDILKASSKQWNAIRGKKMSMVFQDPMMSLNPVIKVGDQLVETIRIHEPVDKSTAIALATAALAAVGIPAPAERMNAYPHELSGGMRQRIAIANAIVNEPAVVIADEPTTALDVTIQAQILYQIRKLTSERRTALLWITHDLSVVKDLADDVCVMYAGKIVESGPVSEVVREPLHPYTKGLIDSLPKSSDRGKLLNPIPGSTPPLLDLPQGCAFAPRCSRATDRCQAPPELFNIGERKVRCFHPLLKSPS